MSHQHLIWPWETKRWVEIKKKTCEKINSIVDLDGRLSSVFIGILHPRQIIELFNTYYRDEDYTRDRIPQDVLIGKIIPCIQELIEMAPKTFRGFNSRLLISGSNGNVVLNRLQVATIIACMWFGLFNYNYVSKGTISIEEFPEPTLVNVFTNRNIFVLQCILGYFARVESYINDTNEDNRTKFNRGRIIIKRHFIEEDVDWVGSNIPITEINIKETVYTNTDNPVKVIHNNADDSSAKLHVAYSHEMIGGKLFEDIITQEEIIMLVRPECIVATLFCAKMNESETITILGAEKISQYFGYGSSVKYAGNFIDSAPNGYSADKTEELLQRAVIFIDASSRTSSSAQFIHDFDRDLKKAFVGFSSLKFSKVEKIASGNWTYGFNGNNMQIKFIQQVIAASAAGKSLVYYPLGRDFEEKLLPFVDWILRNRVTVGSLYNLYKKIMQKYHYDQHARLNELDIFERFIEEY